MNIVCLGGGLAGRYFALLMKLQDLAHAVTVVESNQPFDTLGRGVVLSGQALANLHTADAISAAASSRPLSCSSTARRRATPSRIACKTTSRQR